MQPQCSKFRPVAEPRTPAGVSEKIAELEVSIDNREHLNWAAQLASHFILDNNDWSDSIRLQGVMEPVILVPTTFVHGDGTDPVTTLTTADGSSRLTATHDILKIRSSDVPCDDQDTKLRAYYRKLNEQFDQG